VEIEIRPEPSPPERKAILAALESQLADGEASAVYRSAWRAEGIRQNVDDSAEHEQG
jgi:hypothetical protein